MAARGVSLTFFDDRPCVQLRVAGRLAPEATLTLLLDLWTPDPHKVLIFHWTLERVRLDYTAIPSFLTFHDRYRRPVNSGLLTVIASPWSPAEGFINAAILNPPLGGRRNANGDHELKGIVAGYACFSLFTNGSLTVDFDTRQTTLN